jgi:hypothetical protein
MALGAWPYYKAIWIHIGLELSEEGDMADAPQRQPLGGELPLLGETTITMPIAEYGPQRPLVPQPPTGPGEPAAPVVVLHGVGDFEPGDVIDQIAKSPVFSRGDDFVRETAYVREHRYTLLRGTRLDAAGAHPARLMEVNWSDVRRAMPNAWALLRHFVIVLLTLTRIGVYGAWRSRSLSMPLVTGPIALWLIEAVLVWAALAPALSALLWQLEAGQRLAAGLMVAVACGYAALLLRRLSVPLAAGALAFAVFALAGGIWTCFFAGGHRGFAQLCGQLHSWAVIASAAWAGVAAAEIVARGLRRQGVRWVHLLSRVGCLWLPMVLLTIMQPLSVSALLLPMNKQQRENWGMAFSLDMPFSPIDGQRAGNGIALALIGALILGALMYKAVQKFGRNEAVFTGWGVGLSLLLGGKAVERGFFDGCELCQACLRTDWLGIVGVLMVLSASVTWILFSRSDVSLDAKGEAWFPAGAFARFWASLLLVAMPLVLLYALGWLTLQGLDYAPTPAAAPDAAAVFFGSTKFALLLAPLATRPFAAFLDALGDVFFFVVRDAALHTRRETQSRLWQAVRHLEVLGQGQHIVLFAHSQGTVIAATVLSRIASLLLRSSMRVTLVTVGSPVTTLYRNFLGVDVGGAFAWLCQHKPQRFAWINLYRPADYIGGAVVLPGVENRELLTPGDHIGYWHDPVLLRWVKGLAQGRRAG